MTNNIRIIFTVIIWSLNLTAQEAEKSEPIKDTSQTKIDSLQQNRLSLQKQIHRVDSLLKVLKNQKAEIDLEQFKGGVVLTTIDAWLWQAPHPNAVSITRISGGTKIIGIDYADEYWKVSYKGTIGYFLNEKTHWSEEAEKFIEAAEIRHKKLRVELEERQKKVEANKRWVKVLTGNVRSEPNTKSEILYSLAQGEPLYVQRRKKEWLNVMFINSVKIPQRYFSHTDFKNSYNHGWIHESVVSKERVTKLTSSQLRRQEFVRQNRGILKQFMNAVLNGKIELGMSQKMVLASWGPPDETNKSVGSWGVNEQWIYGNYYFLYFENGVLTSWQN